MILFIDDEPQYISSFVQAFELSNFDVEVITSIDEALIFVENHSAEIDIIILDVMMPAESWIKYDECREGLRTGILFTDWLKKFDEEIPVLILTNANKSYFKELTHRNCQVYEKKEIDPWKLVERMDDIKRRRKFND